MPITSQHKLLSMGIIGTDNIAKQFADGVRRADFVAAERAKQASLDIARTLEAIVQSAHAMEPITL
jgi:hypothetical protein